MANRDKKLQYATLPFEFNDRLNVARPSRSPDHLI